MVTLKAIYWGFKILRILTKKPSSEPSTEGAPDANDDGIIDLFF